MKSAVEKVQNEVQKQEERNENLQSHLAMLRNVLAVTFKDVPLPGSKETPTADTIDSYMTKLQTTISNEPSKHPALVEKVSSIAKHLEKILKERLSQETLSGTVLEGAGGTSDGGGEGVASGDEGVASGDEVPEPMVT